MQTALRISGRKRQRGFVLLTVLWMSLGLLLAASTYLATQRQAALSTRAEVETTRAVELARSAVNVALADLGRIREDDSRSMRDGSPTTIIMAEGQATYRIWDEGGKLDINHAPQQLLGSALRLLGEDSGIDAFDAVTIAQALIIQRDGTQELPFNTPLPQLLSDLGLPQEVALRARQILTTYNGTNKLNPRTASPTLLAAVPGLGATDVATIVERRRAGLSMPHLGSATTWLSGTEGPFYTIEARSTLQSGVSVEVIATVLSLGVSFRGGKMRYEILGMEILR